jgi:uncharacterized protein
MIRDSTKRMIAKGTSRLISRALAGVLLAIALAAMLHVVLAHYRIAKTDFEPWPGTSALSHPESVGIAGLANVSFRSKTGNKIVAWYVPSHNKAAVILAHGTNADRSAMLPELRFLSNAGFGVLAFDWPGDGGSEGDIHWGESERQTLTAAVDWLMSREDIDKGKIGAFGFSMGGYITAQVASLDERISAVTLAAAPPDFVEYTQWVNRRWGWVSTYPAMVAVRASGMPVAELRPIEVIQNISPRPLLILGGDLDPVIPEFMTRSLYTAAKEPKSLWIAPGAGHGNYAEVNPVAYQKRLVEFFSKALAI